jgi:hypothetical protein
MRLHRVSTVSQRRARPARGRTGSPVLVKQATKEVAPAHPGSLSLADQGHTGGWTRRFQPKRSVWTMSVVVLDVHPEDLLQVTTADDQQPVEALGADGTDPPLRIGVGVRRLDRRDEHLGTLGAEHLVEPATELRVAVAEHKAQPQSPIRCRQEQVAGLLGDPGTIGVGRHAGQVDPAGGQFDKEQHIQPPQPDGVDREEVAGEDAGRLLV